MSKDPNFFKDKTHLEWSRIPFGFQEDFEGTQSSISVDCTLVKCNLCQKTIYQHSYSFHLEQCKKIKQKEKKASIKRKREKDVKDKKESIPKKVKPVKASPAPIDLDKQCGVIADNGIQCLRSIMCKIHTVSAKRAVIGRSMNYDTVIQLIQNKREITIQSNELVLPVGNRVACSDQDALLFLASMAAFRPTPMATNESYSSLERWKRTIELRSLHLSMLAESQSSKVQ